MIDHYVKNWTDRHGAKQQELIFPLEQHISRIIITKEASNKIIKKLASCNIPGEIIIKKGVKGTITGIGR